MRTRKRSLLLLFASILSFLALAGLIYFSPPTSSLTSSQIVGNISLISFIHIPSLFLFFVLLALFLFCIGTYIFKSKKHGVLIALFVIIYLLFRLNHLTHPFFLVLLLALFFTLEMLVSSKNGSQN